jgi:hypothetical protein
MGLGWFTSPQINLISMFANAHSIPQHVCMLQQNFGVQMPLSQFQHFIPLHPHFHQLVLNQQAQHFNGASSQMEGIDGSVMLQQILHTQNEQVESSQCLANKSIDHRRFTREEDERIIEFVRRFGPSNWEQLAKMTPGRDRRSLRLRWVNSLSKHEEKRWSEEDDQLLEESVKNFGRKWSMIRNIRFPDQTDTFLKKIDTIFFNGDLTQIQPLSH